MIKIKTRYSTKKKKHPLTQRIRNYTDINNQSPGSDEATAEMITYVGSILVANMQKLIKNVERKDGAEATLCTIHKKGDKTTKLPKLQGFSLLKVA